MKTVHCYELSRLCRAFYYYFVGNDDLPFELDLDEIDLSTWDSAMVSRLNFFLFILCIMHRKDLNLYFLPFCFRLSQLN